MFTAVLCLALTAPAAEPKTLLDALTTTGLEIPSVGRHKLPRPTLDIGMSKEKILAAVMKLGEEYEGTEHHFTARNLNARYPLERGEILDKAGQRAGLTIDVWFAAYGNIKDLDTKDMLQTLMGVKDKDRAITYLSDEELKQRKLTPQTGKDFEERFAILDTVLIEKIKLTGIVRSQKYWVDGALITAMELDDRFLNDKKYPNRWQKANDEKEDRKLTFGDPHPYKGFGGYVKATPLPGTKDGMVIEMHFALAEPYDWFDGKNQLGSKLRTGVTNNVRALRSKLVKGR
jgi:hypothetical protein